MREPADLTVEELAAIYLAAMKLERPWSAMLGLVILTGRPMADVRQIGRSKFDRKTHAWKIVRNEAFGFVLPYTTLVLAPEAVALLEPYLNGDFRFFPSRTSHLWKPANFSDEIVDKARTACSLTKRWYLGDCSHSAAREIERLGGGDSGHLIWCKTFGELMSAGSHARPAVETGAPGRCTGDDSRRRKKKLCRKKIARPKWFDI